MAIGGLTNFSGPSGGITSESDFFLIAASGIYIRANSTVSDAEPAILTAPGINIVNSNIEMFTNEGKRPTVNNSGIMFADELQAATPLAGDFLPVDHRAVSGQILPAVQNSGLYLGNRDHVFGKLHASGLYFKSIPQKIPTGPLAPEPGDIWAVDIPETCGGQQLFCDTGSGIVNISQGSGIFYTELGDPAGSGSMYKTISKTIPFDTDHIWDSNYMHDASDDATKTHIYVRKSGWYRIYYTCSVQHDIPRTYDGAEFFVRCVKNNTIEIPELNSFVYCMGTNVKLMGTNGMSTQGICYLDSGDSFSVQIKQLVGNNNRHAIPNSGCSLMMEYIRPNVY